MDEPYIKLFLSVDIAGSTKLKNVNNYYQIQDFCEEYTSIEKKFIDSEAPAGLPPKTPHKVIDVYKQICENESHQDWSDIIERCLGDFHYNFNSRLHPDSTSKSDSIIPWKMAGDELIYCIPVPERKDVYNYLLAFFLTLRYFDKQYYDKGSEIIRLKGSAWTAGFPIRNRRMTPIKYLSQPNLEDYMGPEIDIGFRISKHTFPGLMVVSLELAYILTDSRLSIPDDERIGVIDTGWEELKGVWEGNKYPIFWIDLPQKYYSEEKANNEEINAINYTPYKKWEIEKDSHVSNYVKKLAKKAENKCYETQQSLDELIESLPPSFDVVKPYFIKEDKELPKEHKSRAEFIKEVEAYKKSKEKQKTVPEIPEIQFNSEDLKNMAVDFFVDMAAGALKKYLKGEKKKGN